MAGIPQSIVKFNSREQLLTADVNRLEWLASREAQDREAARSRSFDCAAPTPTSPANLLSNVGSPISGLEVVPTFVFSSGYVVTIGAGSGYLYDPTFATLSADDSPYLTMRWPQQNVTFANPHATLPRIDVVVATAGAADTDSQSRLVLVDPVTRTITPQNVFKTTNPLSTLSVVTGAAGANPAIPALPPDSMPLFYLWVVPSAPTAATFGVCRASWRRAPHPFSSMSGVISGMGLLWDNTADPASTSAAVIAKGFHRIVVDGELLEFYANMDSTVGGWAVDSANNPFGSAAPSTWHRPYYVYAVGGRHNPRPSFNTSDGFLSPVTIVESLTPPDVKTNKPTANLNVNGTVTPDGAVYIGLGFVAANTTRRLACIMNETWTTFGHSASTNKLSHTKAGSGIELVGSPTSKPSISTRAKVVLATLSGAVTLFALIPDDGSGAAAAPSYPDPRSGQVAHTDAHVGALSMVAGEVQWPAGSNGNIWLVGGVASDGVEVNFNGFDHGVGHIGVHVNP